MPEKKLVALDSLRGLNALAVVASHLLVAFYPWLYGPRNRAPLRLVDESAFHVRVFLVLSGFVLSLSYLRSRQPEALRSAAVRRYFRLVVPAALSVALAYALMAAGLMYNQQCGILQGQEPTSWLRSHNRFEPSLASAAKEAVWWAFLDYHQARGYNAVLWAIEVQLKGSYLLFAFLALSGPLRNRWLAYGVTAAALLGADREIYLCPIAGAALCDGYLFLAAREDARWLPGWACAGFALTGVLLGCLSCDWLAAHGLGAVARWSYLWKTGGACLLVAGVVGSPATQRAISALPLARIGVLSYPLYLVHFLVMLSLGGYVYCLLAGRVGMGHGPSVLAASVATVAVSLALAWVGTRTVERFAIGFGRAIDGWLFRPGKAGLRGPGDAALLRPPRAIRLQAQGDKEPVEIDEVTRAVVPPYRPRLG